MTLVAARTPYRPGFVGLGSGGHSLQISFRPRAFQTPMTQGLPASRITQQTVNVQSAYPLAGRSVFGAATPSGPEVHTSSSPVPVSRNRRNTCSPSSVGDHVSAGTSLAALATCGGPLGWKARLPPSRSYLAVSSASSLATRSMASAALSFWTTSPCR